ncbi:MAG: hypothetical protein AB1Z23_12630 [Eubacteriales bacterium]
MEFDLRKPRRWGLRYGLVMAMVPAIFAALIILLAINEGIDVMIEDPTILYVFLGISVFWILIFIYPLAVMGIKNHKIIIDEYGIVYSSPKRKVSMKWDEIGDIKVSPSSKLPMLYIFSKELSKEDRKKKEAWLRQKGEMPKNISKELIFCEYYKELYSELKKYYNDEIISEYKLALRGVYEN